jgi:hypothetical protein
LVERVLGGRPGNREVTVDRRADDGVEAERGDDDQQPGGEEGSPTVEGEGRDALQAGGDGEPLSLAWRRAALVSEP